MNNNIRMMVILFGMVLIYLKISDIKTLSLKKTDDDYKNIKLASILQIVSYIILIVMFFYIEKIETMSYSMTIIFMILLLGLQFFITHLLKYSFSLDVILVIYVFFYILFGKRS